MPDDDTQAPEVDTTPEPGPAPAKKAARKAPAKKTSAKKATSRTTKKAAAAEPAEPAAPVEVVEAADSAVPEDADQSQPVKRTAAKRTATKKAATKRAAKKTAAPPEPAPELPLEPSLEEEDAPPPAEPAAPAEVVVTTRTRKTAAKRTRKSAAAPDGDPGAAAVPAVLFQAPDATAEQPAPPEQPDEPEQPQDADDEDDESSPEGDGTGRRRRRRGGRRRRKSGDGGSQDSSDDESAGDDSGAERSDEGPSGAEAPGEEAATDDSAGESSSRRRRRRRRTGDDAAEGSEDTGRSEKPAARARRGRTGEDQITAVSGSTRLEAKKQRRREGREAGRRRAPIVSEAEFLARRESVDRVMVVRQRDDLTQIGVLEDKVLVEHYVSRESQTSLIGNVYLGRVQNVLPSMEAAFIDIGRGRNAVLYAGEVNWSALGHKDGQVRKIESVLSSGQSVLVQVTKDPIGHKGARLTSQISLAGRFLVYVPDGTTSGISRKLPDTERNRLKTLLKDIVPDTAGVIVRTAAEGASEEELTRDVERLKERFAEIEKKTRGSAPQLLYGEPDLTVKVVRDLFTEDFVRLVVQGDDAWDTVQGYVSGMAPDLEERLERYEPAEHGGADLFSAYRVDEQIAKALDRKVWLPSGGSLVIDRTEAMTVVDVNTGKFTGSGGNLEETVTKNNLEAAEEVVRQLRLRDIGGIIVVDFIDMVLESNRDLVLRRLVECLGRDRTRHQVAEVTSLGLVQMTRKRIGTGLLEAFGEPCEHCHGRGLVIHDRPVESHQSEDEPRRGAGRRSRGGRGRGADESDTGAETGANGNGNGAKMPSPAEFAAMARHRDAEEAAEAAEAAAEEAAADVSVDLSVDLSDDLSVDTVAEVEVLDEVETDAEASVEEDLETARVADAVAAVLADQPIDEPAAVEPETPKVVTRTRRRSASRPAGPPTPVAAADTTAHTTAHTTGEPLGGGLAVDEAGPDLPDAVEVDGSGSSVEHVPIKRRGSRKR